MDDKPLRSRHDLARKIDALRRLSNQPGTPGERLAAEEALHRVLDDASRLWCFYVALDDDEAAFLGSRALTNEFFASLSLFNARHGGLTPRQYARLRRRLTNDHDKGYT